MVEDELEDRYEKIIHGIKSSLEVLKSCDDYYSQEVCDAIKSLTQICWDMCEDTVYQKLANRLVNFMVEQGLVELLIKISQSNWSVGIALIALTDSLIHVDKSTADEARVELSKRMIPLLVKELDTYDPNTTDRKHQVLIKAILDDFGSVGKDTGVITMYQAENAVDVLKKFAQSDDMMIMILSLQTLAYIVDEKETECITTSRECILSLLDMTHKAAQSDEREYQYVTDGIDGEEKTIFITLLATLKIIKNLAENDANMTAMMQNGGLSILTAVLKPEYEDRVQLEAIKVLWKLSFQETNQDVMKAHLSLNAEALQGKYQFYNISF